MDFFTYLQFASALIFVIALIGALALLARRFGFGGAVNTKGAQARRLAVVEVRPLDAKRKLVLVRRDRVEHLVILGASGETLIEAGIPAPSEDFAEAVRAAATPTLSQQADSSHAAAAHAAPAISATPVRK